MSWPLTVWPITRNSAIFGMRRGLGHELLEDAARAAVRAEHAVGRQRAALRRRLLRLELGAPLGELCGLVAAQDDLHLDLAGCLGARRRHHLVPVDAEIDDRGESVDVDGAGVHRQPVVAAWGGGGGLATLGVAVSPVMIRAAAVATASCGTCVLPCARWRFGDGVSRRSGAADGPTPNLPHLSVLGVVNQSPRNPRARESARTAGSAPRGTTMPAGTACAAGIDVWREIQFAVSDFEPGPARPGLRRRRASSRSRLPLRRRRRRT